MAKIRANVSEIMISDEETLEVPMYNYGAAGKKSDQRVQGESLIG